MTLLFSAAGLSVVLVAIFGVLLPWLAMRALVPALSGGPLETANYRGRPVSATLGAVWPIWALGLFVGQTLLDAAVTLGWNPFSGAETFNRIATTPLSMPLFSMPFLLVAGTFAFGLLDDAFGSYAAKGFRGHLAALRHGHLTTGMLKLLGVGAIAFVYGNSAAAGILERSGITADAGAYAWLYVGAWLLSACAIALSANFVNLLDCRPGRALKAYAVLVIAPAVTYVLTVAASYNDQTGALVGVIDGVGMAEWEIAVTATAFVLALLGPVFAVWRFDLGERAMLGDSGANVMGAIIGYLLTGILPLAGLAIAVAVLLGLNLLSERVSFSAIIERTPPLAFLDGLGRGRGSDGEDTSRDTAGQSL